MTSPNTSGDPNQSGAVEGLNPEQINFYHRYDDLDTSPEAHHHTLGPGLEQASSGAHTHDGRDSKVLSGYSGNTHSHPMFGVNVLHNTTGYSLNTPTTVSFTALSDTIGTPPSTMWAIADPTKVYAPVAGLYRVDWSFPWAPATTAAAHCIGQIAKNGSGIYAAQSEATSGHTLISVLSGGGVIKLAAGDYLQLKVDIGPQTAVVANVSGGYYINPGMTLVYLGPI